LTVDKSTRHSAVNWTTAVLAAACVVIAVGLIVGSERLNTRFLMADPNQVAGDPALIERFLLYRTYHGCAMPVPTQLASIAAWSDDAHVAVNRGLYQEKFDRVLPILSDVLELSRPEGGFYLWPDIDGDDAQFTRALYERTNMIILPGSYLARDANGANPGASRVRISLVPALQQCIEAAERLRGFLDGR